LGLATGRELATAFGVAVVIILLVVLLKETVVNSTTRSRGLGVARGHVQAFFEQPLFGFTVTSVDTVNGQPVLSMRSPAEGKGELKLFGPKRELTRALMAVGVSRNDNSVTAKSAIYLNGFVMIVARDWTEGATWVRDNLGRALSSGFATTTLANPNRAVSLRIQSDEALVILSIESDLASRPTSEIVRLHAAARSSQRRASLFSQRGVPPKPLAS
jgi:hypothetical protein